MKKTVLYLRLSLLALALTLTALSMAPAPAEAAKSCEYYCGPAGPYSCPYAPAFLNCTWTGF
ncbi:MAG TPA: hypothetical protein VNW71_12750 [Thermoanaerobaculia bacterium]|jgi:hypothetical protein|nr:hypothetical protein [Thermoanaerobaculia bacterium]